MRGEDFGEGAGRAAAMAPGPGSMHDGCGRRGDDRRGGPYATVGRRRRQVGGTTVTIMGAPVECPQTRFLLKFH